MSGFRADRESVALLRVSARALIDETISEPCWGLAHGLADLIEGLVSSSGKPAEYFGKEGGQVYGPEEAEFMPECCPACGEWAGQHESWCSHAHGGQAERPESAEPAGSGLLADGYVCRLGGLLFEFRIEGGTPTLYRLSPEGEYYFAEGEICEYAYCGVDGNTHGAWFAHTYTQYEGEWEVSDTLQVSLSARDVEPVATSRQALAEVTAEAASLESLLTWLDLSGLPPVPPPEPPARKSTNWRFDGPEGSEQIPL
mgnify:FL=1